MSKKDAVAVKHSRIVVDVPDATLRFAEVFFRGSTSKLAHSCFMRLVNGLPMPDLLPTDFLSEDAEESWFCICLFKKLNVTSNSARRACFDEYMRCERACVLTNRKFNQLLSGTSPFLAETDAVLLRASEKIAGWLGRFDHKRLETLCRHGQRSDTAMPYRRAHLYTKWSSAAYSSDGCKTFVRRYMSSGPDYWSTVFSPTREDSVYNQVPKTIKTERPISIENRWNMYYQLGLGELIVQRLHRARSFSLKDQPDRNRALAQKAGSLGLCTVDLSSASDRICTGLVQQLLPFEWLEPLSLLRSKSVSFDGRVFHISKFSGMGNGFTFPLQTMIFWALTEAITESLNLSIENISVFGDDIVAPSGSYDRIIEVFADLGLLVNDRKSFNQSIFYESCGGDYYDGVDIRPVFIKEELSNVPAIMDLAKRLFEYLGRRHRVGSFVRRYLALRRELRSYCPADLRFFGPPEAIAFPPYGRQVVPSIVIHRTFDARLFQSLKPIPRRRKRRGDYYSLIVRLTSGGFGNYTLAENEGYKLGHVSAIYDDNREVGV